MKDQKHEGPNKRALLNVVLLIIVLAELVICAGAFVSEKNALEYGIEYEKSPLVLKRVEVINREDLRDAFSLYEDETLYEICLTCENVADYDGRFRNQYDLKTEDKGYYIGMVFPEKGSSIGREAVYNQVVPAGKTGSFRFFVAAPADAEGFRLSEEEDKLSGKGETLLLGLPAQALERDVWEAAE